MLFYRIRNSKLYDYASYKYSSDCLETDIITQAELDEHPNKVIVEDGVLVLNPDFDNEETQKREANFKAQFFEIQNYGWYRKIPKGYSSAVESLNTAFNVVSIMGKLPADMLIFYATPDFSDPEQCTEEWLVEHQVKNQEMTEQEFGQFYVLFMTAWNTQEHVNLEGEGE